MKLPLQIISILLGITLFSGCSSIRYIPTETKEVINYIDSLVIKDSTVIIPIERIVDIVPVYDTLTLETSVAKSTSYVDTMTHSLKGQIENKQGQITKYVYKDRYIERTDTLYIEKPVPVEVEKKHIPPFYKRCTWGFFILLVLVIGFAGLKLYFRRRL